MSELLDAAVRALEPWIAELVGLAAAVLAAWLRAQLQRRAAVGACAAAEQTGLPGREKHRRAVEGVRERLPLGVRPLTREGLEELVETSVPEGRRRARGR
ncbi:MAG: hypothetical protein GWN84_20615 [Gammaproteobacteria bacterium]|nr:hypothetical protein [Gammaproteobacteria bacterium]NIR85165.1 hypothetical protein [Gammaproteobacteria bacterium]NIU06214.1 hypothetical protein [Gammaproteobacteria bacterium]NIX87487.1 hypothetical protein [Gammaproteobacteria bacterium]